MDSQALIDTAEGAHKEIENILQRMRELAVQASNDTNNADDRTNLQAEASSLSEEINRIAGTTSWAGQKLLDASTNSGSFEFQLGSRSSSQDELTVVIGSMTTATLGVTASTSTGGSATLTEVAHNALQVDGTVKTGDVYNFTVNGVALTYTAVASDENSTVATARANIATEIASKIADNVATGKHAGLTVSSVGAVVNLNQDIVSFGTAKADSITAASGAVDITGNQLKLTFSDFSADTVFEMVINSVTVSGAAGDFSAATKYGPSQAGMVQLITDKLAANAVVNATQGLSFSVAASGTKSVTIDVTPSDNTASFVTGVSANAAAGSSTINLDSANNAQSALALIDTAIKNVNAQRASLGSVSNRLDSTVSNLTNISSNLQAGKGRIEDADFAAETTNLAKTQILQQASTAMLAQANASKQNVLSLLQG
jgi:flagellin